MRSYVIRGIAVVGTWMLIVLQAGAASAHEGEPHTEAGTSIGWIGEIGVIVVFGLCAWLIVREHWATSDDNLAPGEERGR